MTSSLRRTATRSNSLACTVPFLSLIILSISSLCTTTYSSGCASPLSIDGVAFGVVIWSTSRVLTVQVGQTVLDRYTLAAEEREARAAEEQEDPPAEEVRAAEEEACADEEHEER